jgi:hypothetical protein
MTFGVFRCFKGGVCTHRRGRWGLAGLKSAAVVRRASRKRAASSAPPAAAVSECVPRPGRRASRSWARAAKGGGRTLWLAVSALWRRMISTFCWNTLSRWLYSCRSEMGQQHLH